MNYHVKEYLKLNPGADEKRYRKFNYACVQASKCRHECCRVSCFSCPTFDTCEIQERIKKYRPT
jgi:hypothetical protein